jgi:hypothetical protein
MSTFIKFRDAINVQVKKMSKQKLFTVALDKTLIWDTYLDAFPAGTNEIYRERREYDCNCCKQFIRDVGRMVTIGSDMELTTVWDIKVDGHFQIVADVMSAMVKGAAISNVYTAEQSKVGVEKTHGLDDDGSVSTWNHFYAVVPPAVVKAKADRGTYLGDLQSSKNVFKRALDEVTTDAVDTVLELIAQNSLYRGEEHKAAVEKLQLHQTSYNNISSIEHKDRAVWVAISAGNGVARIRNSAIGTLLVDLSEDMDLDKAVKSFEAKVAPTNYKRPKALVTKSMIKKAQETVEELGIADSLERRYAVTEDITINNVLFADRSVKKSMNVFDTLANEVKVDTKKFDKVEDISIADFVANVLPKATSLELLVENNHVNNFMSLLAPVHADAPSMLKWDNNFTWSYNGDVTDSIKERVKAAGGAVDGAMRCSLSWTNSDDLDIHIQGPDGHIHFATRKSSKSGCNLDVDMNAGGKRSLTPVENITWPDKSRITAGKYKLFVNQFSKRNSDNYGFDVEFEFDGVTHSFHYDKPMSSGSNVTVVEFKYVPFKGIEIINSLPATTASRTEWEVPTQSFQKVNMLMSSPNHWDEQKVGNKHWFFIVDGCKQEGSTRGFYNEFLKESLHTHRKVFEVLGSKMKVQPSDNQLSGLGFSSTVRNSVVCRVEGAFSRTLKINF